MDRVTRADGRPSPVESLTHDPSLTDRGAGRIRFTA
jgi:hypothetical protein